MDDLEMQFKLRARCSTAFKSTDVLNFLLRVQRDQAERYFARVPAYQISLPLLPSPPKSCRSARLTAARRAVAARLRHADTDQTSKMRYKYRYSAEVQFRHTFKKPERSSLVDAFAIAVSFSSHRRAQLQLLASTRPFSRYTIVTSVDNSISTTITQSVPRCSSISSISCTDKMVHHNNICR